MSFTIGTYEEQMDGRVPPLHFGEKNDYQNALKRNLHNWASWRKDVNNTRIVNSLHRGAPRNVAPLESYLQHSKHAAENPDTLLAFSATKDNITKLDKDDFLEYGIPRVKNVVRRKNSSSKSTSGSDSPEQSTLNSHIGRESSSSRHSRIDEYKESRIHDKPRHSGVSRQGSYHSSGRISDGDPYDPDLPGYQESSGYAIGLNRRRSDRR